MKSFLSLLTLLIVLSGCGFNQYTDSESFEQDENGRRLMTDGYRPENYNKNVDYATQNPTVDISNSALDTSEDQEQLENVIAMEEGFSLGPFWKNGTDAWVTVYTTKQMTNSEFKKKEKQLHQKLQQALPRYDLRVNLTYKK